MRTIAAALLLFSASFVASGQDVKSTLVKHLKTSKEFTLKVAEAMPADSYDFKMTPAQMSFAEQMMHLAQAQTFFMSYLGGAKPGDTKTMSKAKPDVIAYVTASFDSAIKVLEAATPEQLHATYKTGEGELTGLELVLLDLEHTTNHRASAEMYLRLKGVTPPQYEF